MGVTVSRWTFDGPPPALAELIRELERRTGSRVAVRSVETHEEATRRLHPSGRITLSGPYSDYATVEVPGISPRDAFRLARADRFVEAEGPFPPHRYLWTALDAAARALGGVRGDGAHLWRPDAESEVAYDRSWADVSQRDRARVLPAEPRSAVRRWLRRLFVA
jgi:hypothetical protein